MTKNQLIETIRAALDCPTHFDKPKIVDKDPFFKYGNKAIVICDQCVERMRKAIGLEDGESVPSSFKFWNGDYPFKERKRKN